MSQFFLVNSPLITADCQTVMPRNQGSFFGAGTRQGKTVNGAVVRFTERLTLIVNLLLLLLLLSSQIIVTIKFSYSNLDFKLLQDVLLYENGWLSSEICIISTYWGGRG